MRRTIYVLALLLFVSCHQEETTKVEIDVALYTAENLTSPLVVTIENNTRFAEGFQWTFEGGEPAASDKKDPGRVTFTEPGEHTITLEAWNIGDRSSQTFTVRVDSVVALDFKAEAVVNNYSPADFKITNLSKGATSYKWLFEGGEPTTFEGADPPVVTYAEKGTYTVVLIADNGSNLFTASRDIEVRESLGASFSIIPSFEDADDMEAPLRASFDVRLNGAESLRWECEGAVFSDPQSADAVMLIPGAGVYTVYLEVYNGKHTKKVSQQITVNASTNLRTHRNVKLGINTAQETIGCFYSTRLRRSFRSSEVDAVNGPSIDIAFMGLNPDFTYNLFVSPDKLYETALPDIPGAVATKFINKTELGPVQLTPNQFESMNDDTLLKDMPITGLDYGGEYFTGASLPRVVLFETADGRKGAVLVKELVKKGREDSYMVVDIKVQKND